MPANQHKRDDSSEVVSQNMSALPSAIRISPEQVRFSYKSYLALFDTIKKIGALTIMFFKNKG